MPLCAGHRCNIYLFCLMLLTISYMCSWSTSVCYLLLIHCGSASKYKTKVVHRMLEFKVKGKRAGVRVKKRKFQERFDNRFRVFGVTISWSNNQFPNQWAHRLHVINHSLYMKYNFCPIFTLPPFRDDDICVSKRLLCKFEDSHVDVENYDTSIYR